MPQQKDNSKNRNPETPDPSGLFGKGVLYGTKPIRLDVFDKRLANSHNCVIWGGTDPGKSKFSANLLGRHAGDGCQVFIIAPALRGDGAYARLCEDLDGEMLSFGGDDGISFNPFELPIRAGASEEGKADGWTRQDYQRRKLYLKGLFGLLKDGYIQENGIDGEFGEFPQVLDRVIDATYRKAGIDVPDTARELEPPASMPSMEDCAYIVSEMKDGIAADGAAVADGKMSSLELLEGILAECISDSPSGKARLFSGTNKVGFDNRCILFSLGNIEEHLRGIASYLCLGLVAEHLFAREESAFGKRIFFLDESWKLMGASDDAALYLTSFYRECRKFMTGTWLLAQSREDFRKKTEVLRYPELHVVLPPLPDDIADMAVYLGIVDKPELFEEHVGDISFPGAGLLSFGGKAKETTAIDFSFEMQ